MRKALQVAECRSENLREQYSDMHTKDTIMLGRLTAMATTGGFCSPELTSLKAPSLDELERLEK